MDLALTRVLRCPACGGTLEPHPFETSDDGRCRIGVLLCRGCAAWYPVSEFVGDLLPEEHAEPRARDEFFARHGARLQALRAQAAGGRPPALGSGFAAQAHQRDHFDDLALRGDEFSYAALGRQSFQIAQRQIAFGAWRPQLPARSLILDIGCADGISSFDIARDDVTVLGFDVSRQGLLQAAARARSHGVPNVSFFVGDANSIPIADDAIDCVLCFGSLHHVPDPARTLGEAARVLKGGGLYFGMENNVTPLRPVFDLLMRLRPLWREEAGAEAQIGRDELRRWTEGTDLELTSEATVFVPPHLCNRLSVSVARWLLRLTDGVFGRLPLIRNWGGLIEIQGRQLGSHDQPRSSALRP